MNFGARSAPDVSFNDAAASPYAYVYGGATLTGSGSSVAATQWAALITLADEAIKDSGGSTLSTTQVENALYGIYNSASYTTDFHDITTGNNGFNAGPGYDLVTGIGSPIANKLVPVLANGDPIPMDPQPALPEPMSLGLLGIASLAIAARRRRA